MNSYKYIGKLYLYGQQWNPTEAQRQHIGFSFLKPLKWERKSEHRHFHEFLTKSLE